MLSRAARSKVVYVVDVAAQKHAQSERGRGLLVGSFFGTNAPKEAGRYASRLLLAALTVVAFAVTHAD